MCNVHVTEGCQRQKELVLTVLALTLCLIRKEKRWKWRENEFEVRIKNYARWLSLGYSKTAKGSLEGWDVKDPEDLHFVIICLIL